MAAHGKLLQAGFLLVQFSGEFFADRKTSFGETDGGRHHLRELQRAVAFQRQLKPGDRSRNRYRTIAEYRAVTFSLGMSFPSAPMYMLRVALPAQLRDSREIACVRRQGAPA